MAPYTGPSQPAQLAGITAAALRRNKSAHRPVRMRSTSCRTVGMKPLL